MLRIINSNFNGEMYIKSFLTPRVYNNKVVVAELLDSDEIFICELYEKDDITELTEKLSKAKSADEIVDIMLFENMMFGDSAESIENTYLTEYEEGLYGEYDEDETRKLVKNEKEWFETVLKPQINRIGNTYILINF